MKAAMRETIKRLQATLRENENRIAESFLIAVLVAIAFAAAVSFFR